LPIVETLTKSVKGILINFPNFATMFRLNEAPGDVARYWASVASTAMLRYAARLRPAERDEFGSVYTLIELWVRQSMDIGRHEHPMETILTTFRIIATLRV
jgi:hypothetical protein